MSSFKELNGPLDTDFHTFQKLGAVSDPHHPSSSVDLSPGSSKHTTCVQSQRAAADSFISFDQSIPKRLSLGGGEDRSNEVQHLRSSMPDQTRCIINAAVSNLSDPITIATKSNISTSNQQQRQPFKPVGYYAPITAAILQHQTQSSSSPPPAIRQTAPSSGRSSPRIIRRYSKPQGDACDADPNPDLDPQQDSSVDGDHVDIELLKNFKDSVKDSRFRRRRSSPEILASSSPVKNKLTSNLAGSSSGQGQQPPFPTSVNNNSDDHSPSGGPSVSGISVSPKRPSAISQSTASSVSFPLRRPHLPPPSSGLSAPSSSGQPAGLISKMVGTTIPNNPKLGHQTQQQQPPPVDNLSSTLSSAVPTLIPSKSCPRFHTLEDDHLHLDIYSMDPQAPPQSSTLFGVPSLPLPSHSKSSLVISNDCNKTATNSDFVDSSIAPPSSSGFGFLSRTRQFGTWISGGFSATEPKEKVEISKKDLNVFAPTTF